MLDDSLGQVQFESHPRFRGQSILLVRVRVVSNVVAFGVLAAEQIGGMGRGLAYHKKCGGNMFGFQDVEDPWCIAWIGTVVEGQREKFFILKCEAFNEIPSGHTL